MNRSTRALVLVLAVWLAACDNAATRPSPFLATPTAPTATPAPTPPRTSGERWSLTTTLTAATGGDACGLTYTPGRTARWLLIMTPLGGGRVNVIVADEQDSTDRVEYTGVIDHDTLTMADGHTGTMLCNGTRVDIESESRVDGTFVGDGHTLLAEQKVTARLASGQMLTWVYDWRASWPHSGG